MTVEHPYSLKNNRHSSDAYYEAISAFTSRWLAAAEMTLARPVRDFQSFLDRECQQPRTFAEVAFEVLALGVLLREHGEQALNMAPAPAWILARLVEAQDRLPLPAVEKPVKAMRGLIRGLAQPEERTGASPDTLPSPTAAALVEKLVDWLLAEGLTAQAERMADWRAYLSQMDDQLAQAILARSLLLAEEFEPESQSALDDFTAQAAAFSSSMEACSRWRYDGGLVARRPVEYHLGMLGTEILTRAYRERFQAMPRKIVIMPDCLCARSRRVSSTGALECQAQRTDLGLKCQGCTPACKVNQITRLGERRGFEAYILPDDYRGVGLGACRKLEGVGVVGVSCALTNWDAGWQVNAAGVPAQGVLLDYAGCKSHWDEEGIPTDVNVKKLLEMVGG